MSKNQKMVLCKKCNAAMDKTAKACPVCGAKNKKPLFKRWWFWILIFIIFLNVRNYYKDATRLQTESLESKEDTITSEIEMESEQEVEKMPEVEKQENTAAPSTQPVSGLRPEFKNAMDSYESFMIEYCDFMKKYAESDGTDLEMLADYTEYMSKYVDVCEDFEAWDSQELNTEELAYYLDVQNRINQRLLEVE